MIGVEHIHRLSGRELHDRDGNKIGTVGQIWDDGAGRPGWASVRTGLFGLNESLVPLNDAELRDDQVVVPYDKATVKDAPNVDASEDEPLDPDEVDRLYQHYGLNWEDKSRTDDAGATATRGGAGDGMTRSEERLNVDKQREQVARARLRKYVVTEHQQEDGRRTLG